MQDTYWNENGKYQEDYERLNQLMPHVDNAETLAGELVRSYNRITYDYYNNGMGNNTSGALNFLKMHCAISKETHKFLHDYTRGLYCGQDTSVGNAVESLINETIEYLLKNPHLENTPNEDNIFNYEDDDLIFCEDCDEEIEESLCQSLCDHCQEIQDREENDDD